MNGQVNDVPLPHFLEAAIGRKCGREFFVKPGVNTINKSLDFL